MKKLIFACAVLGAYALQSCNKDGNVLPAPRMDMPIILNWKLTSLGQDSNRDGSIQASEMIPLQSDESGFLAMTDSTVYDSTVSNGTLLRLSYIFVRKGDSIFVKYGPLAEDGPMFVIRRQTATSLDIISTPNSDPTVMNKWRFYTRD